MKTKICPTFDPQFRLGSAQLVVDQHYGIREAATVMGVAQSTMDRWVRQLRKERNGETLKAKARFVCSAGNWLDAL